MRNNHLETPERIRATARPKTGSLRVWHIPQVPMQGFYVYVDSIAEAEKVLLILAEYDLFQYERNVKGDYSNAQGLEVCVEASNDGEEMNQCYEWEEWMDDEGYAIGERERQL